MIDICTLSDDEKITEPGFYRITLDRHHNQPCDGVSVTSGVLRTMELATPADVWAFHKLNPERFEQPETTPLRMGRAMAAYIEGGMDEVRKNFFILPEDKPRRPTPQQIKAYEDGSATDAGRRSVEFWREVDAHEHPPLGDTEVELIEAMGKVLARDPLAQHVMGGIPEVTMAVQDERTGLWLLARPDTVSIDGTVSDFKKMATRGDVFSYRLVDRRITQHGYHMQLAFAAEVFECLTGSWPELAVIVAQMDSPPYHVIAREIAEDDLRKGQFQNRRAITRFHECLTDRKSVV